MNKKAKTILRVIVSILLLGFLFWKFVDLREFYQIIKKTNLLYFILAYLSAMLGIIISSVRWKVILEHNKQKIGLIELISLYFIGKFYNLIIPGTISGDIVRSYKSSLKKGDRATLFLSVFLERIVGFVGLLLVMILGLIILYDSLPKEIIIQLIGLVTFLVIGFLLINYKPFKNLLLSIAKTKFLNKYNLKNKIQKTYRSFKSLKNLKLLVKTLLLSLIFIFLSFLSTFLIAKSINVDIPFLYLASVIPIITIFTMIPISFAGTGIREGLYIYFFSHVGVGNEEAVTIGILGLIMLIVTGLIGGIINLVSK